MSNEQQQAPPKNGNKDILECTVCWGGGKIEVDDYGTEKDCTWCNGTGLVRPTDKSKQQ